MLVNQLIKRFNLNLDDLVLDVGCNDGILLQGYKDSNIKTLGVEPSSVAEIAIESGYNIIKDFFTPSVAKRILREFGQPKVITATNVFVHVDLLVGSYQLIFFHFLLLHLLQFHCRHI